MEFNADRWPLARLAATGRKYGTIMADPPWDFQAWSEKGTGRSAQQHYATQDTEWIAKLGPVVRQLAASNCILHLWTVQTHIPDALRVMEAWGFAFKTVSFTWVKLSRNCPPDKWREHFGMGYYTRANPESLYSGETYESFLGRRGDPDVWSHAVRQLLIAPVRKHSAKPDEIYGRVEELSPGPYLELFARPNPARGPLWNAWGKEVGE